MKIRYRTNLIAGILSIIAAVVLYYVIPTQVKVETKAVHGVTSRTLPYALAVLIAVCGVVLIVQSLVFKKDEVKELDIKKESVAILYMLVILVYGLLFKKSFLLSTCFLAVTTLAFQKCKKPLYYGISVVLVVCLYFIFTKLLHVRLP